MRTALVVLLVFAAVDLIGCGLLLAVVWVEHRRQRRAARDAGQPVPPPATGQFLLLGLLALLGVVGVYATLAFLLTE
jgi:uncharacterized membrane protein